jgi:hypothetical protein
MSKETEKESMFQSFQKTVSSHMMNAKAYVTQKIPFLSKGTAQGKEKDKASTDSFADAPPAEQPKNYTVLATTLTDVVSQLQALPTDSKGLRESLTNGVAILQDLKGTLLQGDPSKRDQSHASAITDVIQNLEKLSKESTTSVNTSNLTTVMAIATTTLNTVASTMTQVSASGIFNKIIEIIQQLIYPLLILYLASLVSNEMIVYPAPMRFFFFLFVLTLCSVFSPATVILVFYYLVKAGYSYYRNELEDRDGDTTPIRIYPRIFAILPIATTPATSLVGRFFKYPFYYPKTEEDRKELERTDGKGDGKGSIMDEYIEALKESFPYGETVKGSDPFAERYATLEKNMKRMHRAPTVPMTATDQPISKGPTGNPLPPVISKAPIAALGIPPVAPSSDVPNAAKALPATLNAAKALPATLNAAKALPATLNAAKALPATLNAAKAVPGVITPTSTSANILDAMAGNGLKISKAPSKEPASPALKLQMGGALKTRSPTSGGWLWNGI